MVGYPLKNSADINGRVLVNESADINGPVHVKEQWGYLWSGTR